MSAQRIFVSHPTGNTFVRALIRSLEERGMLERFITTVGLAQDDKIISCLPPQLRRQALRRAYPVPPERLGRHPGRELVRLAAQRGGELFHPLCIHEAGWASFDSVAQDLDHTVARELIKAFQKANTDSPEGVYCYEDCALETFRAAKARDVLCVYELPIAYWKTSTALLQEEAGRWPAWEPTLGGTRDSAHKNARKTEELKMADVVITPSAFVHRSLPASIRHFRACHVVPFGSPPVGTPIIPENLGRRGGNGAALRVLFAGSMTQRKGLADLFAAIALLNRSDIELVVMGSLQAPMEFYRSELNHFLYEGPRPHAEVLKLMQSCDVLVLPSIVEGRALVQQEALACGLPLIVTANAGGEDLIEEGKTGFLVPIRSPEAIAERISYLADHTEILSHLRASARQKAAMYTWEHYGDQVTGAISQALSCFPRTAKT